MHEGEVLGIAGLVGSGRTELLRLIAGVEQPSSGTIRRDLTVSWPIGYASAFQASLTGADNVRFIARIYDRPITETLAFVEDAKEAPLLLASDTDTVAKAAGIGDYVNHTLDAIADEINNRPRKGLGVRSPMSVYRELLLNSQQHSTLIH